MRVRLLTLFALVLTVSACSSNKDQASSGAPVLGEREDISQGPLYGTETYESQELGGGNLTGTQQDLVATIGDRVFYGYDQYNLTAEAQETLQRQADWMQQFPNVNVTIEGHCDERGTREYNLALGERRANSAKNYLIALGIAPSRISTISYGKEQPAVLGSNESSWAQNRRGVTRVD